MPPSTYTECSRLKVFSDDDLTADQKWVVVVVVVDNPSIRLLSTDNQKKIKMEKIVGH
jgi:CxxC motif-containing protein